MEFGLMPEDVMDIKAVLAAFPKVKQVVLFGSRAKGNYKPGSDIDFVILGDDITMNDMFTIGNSLENLGMIYSFDLQNIALIKNKDLLDHINRVGIIFYSK